MSYDNLSPEQAAAREAYIQKALDNVAVRAGITQLVLNEGMSVHDLQVELNKRADKGLNVNRLLRVFEKPVTFLNKVILSNLEGVKPVGKPVLLVTGGDEVKMVGDLIEQLVAKDEKLKAKIPIEYISHARQMVVDIENGKSWNHITEKLDQVTKLLQLFKGMIGLAGYESVSIIVDATEIDRLEEKSSVSSIKEQERASGSLPPEVIDLLKIVKDSRHNLGTFVKKLRTITGASIVLTTLQADFFDAKDGMQKDHDFSLNDLRNAHIFGLK